MNIDFIAILANTLKEEVILEQIREHIKEYELVKTEDSKDRLIFTCHLLIIKSITNGDNKKTKEMISDVQNINSFMNAFKSTN